MHVAVAIVGFRNAAEIGRCLDRLAETTHRNFEVVICENGGPAAHTALRAAIPATLPGGQPVEALLAPGNLGYAGGVNACLAARPDADAWWVLNPDTAPEPGALAALVARLERGDKDAVGGTLYHPNGRVQGHGGRWRSWLGRAESIGHGTALDAPLDPAAVEAQQDYLLGASMLIGRRFLEATGPMRDDYFLYAEEVEWCLRAKTRGLRLGFAPDARVLHDQGGTTGSAQSLRQRPRLPIYMDERNKLNVVRDTTPARLITAIPGAFVLLILRYARNRAWAQWRWGLQGWWAGIRGRRGLPPWMKA